MKARRGALPWLTERFIVDLSCIICLYELHLLNLCYILIYVSDNRQGRINAECWFFSCTLLLGGLTCSRSYRLRTTVDHWQRHLCHG